MKMVSGVFLSLTRCMKQWLKSMLHTEFNVMHTMFVRGNHLHGKL